MDQAWTLSNDSTSMLLSSDYIYINNFALQSGKQKCSLHGKFTFEGEEDISIKATTNEQMGFIGRAEGVVAYAVVLLEKTI